MTETPDFDQLARETQWPREAWVEAWEIVRHEPRLWPTVVKMGNPVASAKALVKALTEPMRTGEPLRKGNNIVERSVVVNQIQIHPAPRQLHPCEIGQHAWAWAYLANGGTAQVCRTCGTRKMRG